MDLSLLVVKASTLFQREHALVPDVGMDIEASAAVDVERNEIVGGNVVARQRQWSNEGTTVEWEEQLATVWVVVGVPQQDPLGRSLCHRRSGGRVGRPPQEVLVVDGVVLAAEYLSFPPELEAARSRAAFVASTGVDGAPTGRRSSDDL